MNRQLNLVLNGKGGVGKSFFAVNFIQYLAHRKIPFAAFDSDNENSTLKRFHPDAQFVHLADPRSVDDVFRALEQHDLVVMDCRAASTDLFLQYFAAVDLPGVLHQLSARLTLAMPVNHEADSLDQIQRQVEALAGCASFVVVRNEVHSDSFALYERSLVRTTILKELGGKEIVMPRMESWLVEELNRLNLTPGAATSHEAFHLLDRQRLSTWQKRFYGQLDSAGELLLPPAHIKCQP